MRHNPRFDIKIKLNPDPTSISRRPLWLHVEWFKIGGGASLASMLTNTGLQRMSPRLRLLNRSVRSF